MERRYTDGQSLWRLSRKFRQGNWDRCLASGTIKRVEQATDSTGSNEKFRLLNICMATMPLQSLPYSILESWSAQLLQQDWKSPWNSPDSHLAAMLCTCFLVYPCNAPDTNVENSSSRERLLTLVAQLTERLLKKHQKTLQKYPLVLDFIGSEPSPAERKKKLERVIRLSSLLQCNTKNLTDYLKASSIKSVSVVGNAPTLLSRQDGKKIDSADCVVRFNNVVITPDKVGSTGQNTDIHMCNPGFSSRHTGRAFSSYKPETQTLWLSSYLPYTRPGKYWQELARLNDDAGLSFVESEHENWLTLVKQCEAPPTAGLLALKALSVTQCEINAFGFNLPSTASPSKSETTMQSSANHYGDRKKKSSRHNWQAEAECLRELSRHRINLHL